MRVTVDPVTGEAACEHGVAVDVHCCGEGGLVYPGCHSGFVFGGDCRCRFPGDDDDDGEAVREAA